MAFLFWILYPKFKKSVTRKTPKKVYFKKVMRVAKYGDYYLVNDVKIHKEDPHSPTIDHLLAGNKYLYLIFDYYFEGAVDASLNDEYWTYHKTDGTKAKILNPIKKSAQIGEYFASNNYLDHSFIVTIVLINNDCFISPIKNDGEQEELVPLSKLEKLIRSYESHKVSEFNSDDLAKVIKRFADIKNNAKN